MRRGWGRALVRWPLLIVTSGMLGALLDWLGLPAGLLLGPMVAGMAYAARDLAPVLPAGLFVAAQAVLGCFIASSLSGPIFVTLAQDWPIILGVITAIIGFSAAMGYALSYWRVLPGTTAIWGSMPGASSTMVVMAEAFGADPRLVAVMTYTRVVCVAVTASVLSALFARSGVAHPAAHAGLSWALELHRLTPTIIVAGAGLVVARLLRIPAPALIGPMLLGSMLNAWGSYDIVPPHLLLAGAFAIIGWRIGLGFTRETTAIAARALPRILLSVVLLIAFSGLLSLLLVWRLGIDPVTAYLAASPGGIDSITGIAATNRVDVPFVMALQVTRFFAIMLVGPSLAGAVARRQRRGES